MPESPNHKVFQSHLYELVVEVGFFGVEEDIITVVVAPNPFSAVVVVKFCFQLEQVAVDSKRLVDAVFGILSAKFFQFVAFALDYLMELADIFFAWYNCF